MASLGDFDAGATLYFKFTTFRPSTGAPFTLAGTPAISVYKDASTTQSTAGVTLTADFDAVTGLNHVAIDTSADGTFYAVGSFFDVVVTTGTVDSVSAVGVVVGRFTLRKTACLKPTTAGRALDVSAGGEAGIDLANVGSPTTTLNLSGTTISTSQQVASVSGAVGSVTGSVGSVTGAVGSVTGNVGGSVVGSVASVTGAVGSIGAGGITSASFATGAIDANAMNVTGSEFTAIPWNAAWDAEVQSEVQDAIEVNHLDHLLAATYDPASKPGVADSLFNDLVQNNGAGVSQFTTIALELAPSGGGGGTTDWTANERTAIRSILGIPTSGTTPTDPTAGILDTIRDNTVAIEADTVDIQGRLPAALVSGRMDASVGAMAANVLTASALATDAVTEIVGGVWNALIASYTTADTFGARLLRSRSAQAEVSVTGSNHVAADIHELQPAVIANTHFAAGAIDSNALAASAATEIATATLGATVEGSETLVQAVRLVRAALVGRLSGAATTTVAIRDAANTKNRITATVTADGDRTDVTTDAT
jgi:hypothetical protein